MAERSMAEHVAAHEVYLDYAATTPMWPAAIEAMTPFLAESFGNPSGGHAAARAAKSALEQAREDLADLLGVQPVEVVFTGGGTEADNLAVKGAARACRDRSDAHTLVTTAFDRAD